MRALLVALLGLLLTPGAIAAPVAWAEKSVRVMDYTTTKWAGLVEGMVDEFNGMLPESAPRLAYRRMPERACQDLRSRPFVGAIVVCSVPAAPFIGMAGVLHDGTTIFETRIMLNDRMFLSEREATNTVCHELMHAVTGISDRYDRRPKTSCVWGDLTEPGRFDVAYVRKVYKAND